MKVRELIRANASIRRASVVSVVARTNTTLLSTAANTKMENSESSHESSNVAYGIAGNRSDTDILNATTVSMRVTIRLIRSEWSLGGITNASSPTSAQQRLGL